MVLRQTNGHPIDHRVRARKCIELAVGAPVLEIVISRKTLNDSFRYAQALDAEGTLYISDGGRIRRVYHGRISTFAGGGDIPTMSAAIGQPARRVANTVPSALVLAPNGDLYVSEFADSVILRLHPVVPATANGEKLIVSGDGSEIYVFDTNGRHLRTLDALTKAVKLRFSYNGAGKLARVEDNHGNATAIGYDANGRATSVVGPFSHTTRLEYAPDGYLAKILDPLGREEKFSYGSGGLLTQRTDAGGGVHAMRYDPRGNLLQDANAENAAWTLSRESLSPVQTRVTTGLGRTRLHSASSAQDVGEARSVTHEDGTKTVWTTDVDRGTHVTSPDGTKLDTIVSADPRFGTLAPYVSREMVTLPSGLKRTLDASWSARFDTDGSLLGLDGTFSTADGASGATYDAATRTWTNTTPSGRTGSITLDAEGRIIRMESPGLAPLDLRYDARGRPLEATRGDRRVTYGYDASSGVLRNITDALGTVATFERDAALRVTASVQANGSRTIFGYNALDNVIALTPPGKSAHTMTYGKDGLEASYAAPGAALLSTSYDADRAFASLTHEDGSQTVLERDSAGRPATLRFPGGGTVVTGYDATTGKAVSFTGPGNASVRATYDGSLVTKMTAAGTAPGAITWTYDPLLRVKTEAISGGGSTLTFKYDSDGLRTGLGPVALTRDAVSGLLSTLSVGRLSETFTYTPHGELATYKATGAGASLDLAYTYNNRGLLVEKRENGVVWGYGYDAAHRLARVTKNGVEQASFSFDANGNRTDGGAQVDDQDRLTRRGDATYTYTPRGERATKSTPAGVTKYSYDGRGNLASVELPSGVRIDYQLDAFGRRIARSRNGVITHRWLYRSELQPAAEVDASGNVVTQYIYARGHNVPDAMIRAGVTYALVTDHLGSVRTVVNSGTNAAAVQALDYDAWGRVTSDSSAGFQPFGFAGGMYDPETGLVHLGAREYDPESGTWTRKEPLGFAADLNFYAYANGDPINWIDADGRIPVPVITGILGAAGAGIGNGLAQAARGGPFRWGEFGIAVGVGFVQGALLPFSGGGLGIPLLGAGANLLQAELVSAVYGDCYNALEVGAIGALGGLIGGGAANAVPAGIAKFAASPIGNIARAEANALNNSVINRLNLSVGSAVRSAAAGWYTNSSPPAVQP
ncbi:RHS repeat domain-containing protein [Pendulispora albinea]|uniref:Teneurin-like YD-shell domain-containing protein n=1 Tax=Pendulispora albinea TaxID=2741071 RepID=A0ABZ2MCV9_9BACT